MAESKWLLIIVMIANCFLSAFSQALLKKSALKEYSSPIRSYLNALVICGYGLFFVVLCVNVFLLKFLPLSVVSPVTEILPIGLSFVAGRLLFRESFPLRKIIGSVLIFAGIFFILL